MHSANKFKERRNTMYNGHQKNLFLKNIVSQATRTKVKPLFEKLADYEQEQETDICNINPTLYPQAISQCNMRIQRFEYFYNLYNLLLNYRIFCYSRGLIDPSKYFQYNPDDAENSLPDTEKIMYLYDEFVEHRKREQIPTPEKCIEVLRKTLLPNASVERDYISMDEYRLAYIALLYLGIDSDDVARLKITDVRNIGDKCYVAGINSHCEVNTPEAYKLINKLATVRTIKQITRAGSVRIRPLGSEYLFAYRSDENSMDDIDARMKVRIDKIKSLIRKEMSKYEIMDCPTLSDVIFQGVLYKMCCKERRSDIEEIRNLTYQQWVTLYSYYEHPSCWDATKDPLKDVVPMSAVNVARAVEIKNAFFETYEYLEQNDAWPH